MALSLRHPATRVVASSLVTQAALVVSGPIVVRLLGVEGRGEVAFVFAAVLLVSQVGPWGLPQAWTYFIARNGADPNALLDSYLGRYLRLCVVAAVIGTTGLVLVAHTNDSLSSPVAEGLIVFAAIALVMVAILVMACLQGAQRFNALAILQAVPGIGYASAIVLLAVLDHGTVVLVLTLNFSGWLIVNLVGLWLLRRAARPPSSTVPTMAQLRSFGRRALISASAPIDNLGIDQLLVGLLLSHHTLGLYAIGLAFESGPVLALVALSSVCTATVASIHDPAVRRAYCRRWLVIGGVVGLLAVVFTQVAINLLLTPAFGQDAAPAVPVARILVLAGLFLGLRRMTNGMLQGSGRPTHAAYAETAGFVTMIALMVPLSLKFGIQGSCVALLCGGVVAFISGSGLLLLPRFARASIVSREPSVPT